MLLAILVVAYAVLCLVLYVAQRSMLYYPPRNVTGTTRDTLLLPVPGAVLRVTVRDRPGAKALLYFGGNAEDVSLSLPALASVFPDRAIFMLNYRGYNGSSGAPTEAAIHADSLALFERVHAEHADIAVIGRSLGSGVAVQLAARRPLSALVLVTPYDSIQEIARRQFPYAPIRWLLVDKYESWRYAPAIHAPTLLLAAAHDEIIPLSSTENLYRAFPPGVASLTVIPGAAHNTISESALYLQHIRAAVASAPMAQAGG